MSRHAGEDMNFAHCVCLREACLHPPGLSVFYLLLSAVECHSYYIKTCEDRLLVEAGTSSVCSCCPGTEHMTGSAYGLLKKCRRPDRWRATFPILRIA